jgi:hypothetical protein
MGGHPEISLIVSKGVDVYRAILDYKLMTKDYLVYSN